MNNNSSYDSQSIRVLEGLNPVRKRPGMYIGDTGKRGLHHLLWEVVDNSVDEANVPASKGGCCNEIIVELNTDNSITVTDNGRGIPCDVQTEGSSKGVPAIEVLFTVLHSGGKFDQEASGYQFSGGLHGVGLSVVNALSIWTQATVWRGDTESSIKFGNTVDKNNEIIPGIVLEGLTVKKTKTIKTGTSIRFLPDPSVFSITIWDTKLIEQHIQNSAYLNTRITFTIINHVEDSTKVFHYPDGLQTFLINNLTHTPITSPVKVSGVEEGLEFDAFLAWEPVKTYRSFSFVNGIETSNGGSHVKGIEASLTGLFTRFGKLPHVNCVPANLNLDAGDVRSGLTLVVSAKVANPQFVGQTKDELRNEDVKKSIRSIFTQIFWEWMNQHPVEATSIVSKAVQEAVLRKKIEDLENKERDSSKKIGYTPQSLPLPYKLVDCEHNGLGSELFIVEGDSAAGPAKKARNPYNQAVLPIRGKGLNVEKALHSRDGGVEKIQGNQEIQGIIASIGAGSKDFWDTKKIRYGKTIILTDADNDGSHITMLLLTTFYRLFPNYIREGHVYIARPPLFSGWSKKTGRIYVNSEEEKIKYPSIPGNGWHRFKGLGEMDSYQLEATCINPLTRRIDQVCIEDIEAAEKTIQDLMGTDSEPKWDLLSKNLDDPYI